MSCLLCFGMETPALALLWTLGSQQGGSRTSWNVAPGPHLGCADSASPREVHSFPHFCFPSRSRELWQGLGQILKGHPDVAAGSLLASAEPTGSRSTQPVAQLLRETSPTRLPAGTLTWIQRPLRAGTCPVAFTPALRGCLVPTLLGQVMDIEALTHPPSSRVPPQRPTGMCCAPAEGLWWARIQGPGSCSAHTAVSSVSTFSCFRVLVTDLCGCFGRPCGLAGCAPADGGASAPAVSSICPFCR